MKTITIDGETYVAKADTILDASPDIRFHKMTMVARMDVNEANWK